MTSENRTFPAAAGLPTRRTVLAALPALGLAPAAALALPPAPADTPVQRLFDHWLRLRLETDDTSVSRSDDEIDAMVDGQGVLEEQMMALRSTCPADVAAKIVVYTSFDFGFLDGGGVGQALWSEVISLVPSARALA